MLPSRSLDGHPFLSKGFRPFFFLAAAYAALSLPLWLVALSGNLESSPSFPAPYWHAHEMVFGFTVAVIAGFLLTAVSNWTGRETAVGIPLAALAILWIAGRVAVLAGGRAPHAVVRLIDLAFIPVLALVLARNIVGARSRRNYGFILLLTLLFGANLMMHTGAFQVGARFGVELVVVMIVAMTSRVLPMFTRNATGAKDIRSHPLLDRAAIGATVVLALGDGVGVDSTWMNRVALIAGVLVLGRMWHWGTRHTFGQPLLWILHAASGFIGLGLLLRYFADSMPSVALHALTVGGIGLATLGMMARVALGHTGRTLTPPRLVVVAFILCTLAAFIRILGPWLGGPGYMLTMVVSGIAFAAAFAAYVVAYTKVLFGARHDSSPLVR